MIQLATDPQAARTNWHPNAGEAKGDLVQRPRRSAHAWPFISRHGEGQGPSAPREGKPTHSSESGS